MPVSRRLTKFVVLALVATIAFYSVSCGTILYPERRGQPRGIIDPGVLLLDAVGLVFFIVPGLVAFAVDFSTGAIYYPPPPAFNPGSGAPVPTPYSQSQMRQKDLVKVEVPKDELTQEKIEQVVSEKTGQPVTLRPGQFRAAEMSNLNEFEDQAEKLGDPDVAVPPTAVRFR